MVLQHNVVIKILLGAPCLLGLTEILYGFIQL